MSVPGEWLTTAAAGKRLGVSPGVVTRWIAVGRLHGRRYGGRWRVDPASVEQELHRLSRASWWRRVDLPEAKAQKLQAAATRRLVLAASAWRQNPADPHLTQALIAAIDERDALYMRAKKHTDHA